jgi:hypothetical protein
MSDAATKIVIALISLAGTLAVSYFGYRQWRAGQRNSLRAESVAIRRQTYQALWKMVETVHTGLRTRPKALQSIRHQITQINSYILKNEIYLADDIHELVDSYLRTLEEMVDWTQREGTKAQQDDMATTSSGMDPAVAAVGRTYDLRDKLRARIRKVKWGLAHPFQIILTLVVAPPFPRLLREGGQLISKRSYQPFPPRLAVQCDSTSLVPSTPVA